MTPTAFQTLVAGVAVASAALLAGCGSPSRVVTKSVSIPIPVECQEPTPVRPVMPTESLAPGVSPYVLLRAALAEIDRREGYEVQLRTALENCQRPVIPAAASRVSSRKNVRLAGG